MTRGDPLCEGHPGSPGATWGRSLVVRATRHSVTNLRHLHWFIPHFHSAWWVGHPSVGRGQGHPGSPRVTRGHPGSPGVTPSLSTRHSVISLRHLRRFVPHFHSAWRVGHPGVGRGDPLCECHPGSPGVTWGHALVVRVTRHSVTSLRHLHWFIPHFHSAWWVGHPSVGRGQGHPGSPGRTRGDPG